MTTHKSVTEYTLYGEYNWDDPIYKVLRRETASPRFKIYMMQHGIMNLLFYQYTDMLALQVRGGDDIDDLMRKQRRLLIEEGMTTEPNEHMAANFEEHGTPHADLEETDFHYGDVWCG